MENRYRHIQEWDKLINSLPVALRTERVYQQLANLHQIIGANARRSMDWDWNDFNNYYVVHCRDTICKAISRMPAALQTESNFEALCKIADYAGFMGACINTLPEALQTQLNLNKLYGCSHRVAEINLIFSNLPEELRNSKDGQLFLDALIQSAHLSARDSILMSIYLAWQCLPEGLHTKDNFLALQFKSSPEEYHVALTVAFMFEFTPELLRTQANFDLILQRPINELRSERDTALLSGLPPELFDQILFEKILSLHEDIHEIEKLVAPLFSIEGTYYQLPLALQIEENLTLLRELFNSPYRGLRFNWRYNNATLVSTFMSSLPPALRIQANFDEICRYAPRLDCDIVNSLRRLPAHLFTQEVFDRYIQLCANNDPAHQQNLQNILRNFVAQILEAAAPEERRQAAFNPSQSTHTASIHRTVSESAINLYKRYKNQINSQKKLDGVISKIQEWGNNFTRPLSFQAVKAQNAIAMLADPLYAHTDPVSGISTRQLLALAWIGIQDNELRKGELEDAELKFLTALYDVARGYNVSEDFKEINITSEDAKICIGGSFNKICEALWGIHPDVNLVFVTEQLATQKLPYVVIEEALKYFTLQHQEAKTAEEKEKFFAGLKEIQEKGIDPIWEIIKPKVAARLFDEFGELYKGKEDARFVALLDAGEYTTIKKEKLEIFEPKQKKTAAAQAESVNATFFKGAKTEQDLKSAPPNIKNWLINLNTELDQALQLVLGENKKNSASILKDFKRSTDHILAKTPDLNTDAILKKLEQNLARLIKDLRPKDLNPKDEKSSLDFFVDKLLIKKQELADFKTQHSALKP